MSVLLMYKQRFAPVNRKVTPGKNAAHIRYIATRPGVMKSNDENRERGEPVANGLFGSLNGKPFCHADSVYPTEKYVEKLSREGKNIYRGILSFSRLSAKELGLYRREDWERLMQDHVATIARGNDIKPENFEWVAAVHNERHHPHMHIIFWDKAQEVAISYIPPAKVNSIRQTLTKGIFAEKLQEFYDAKKAGERELRANADSMFLQFEAFALERQKDEYALWQQEFRNGTPAVFDVRRIAHMEALADEYLRIRDSLPKTGRLVYKLLPPEVKSNIDAFAEKLIQASPHFASLVNAYVAGNLDLMEAYTNDEETLDKAQKKYRAQAKTIIANLLLKSCKELSGAEFKERSAMWKDEQRAFLMQELFMELFKVFNDLTESDNQVSAKMGGELSKQAKKEYILKHKDRGIEL